MKYFVQLSVFLLEHFKNLKFALCMLKHTSLGPWLRGEASSGGYEVELPSF